MLYNRLIHLCLALFFCCTALEAQNDCTTVSSAALTDIADDPDVSENCHFNMTVSYQTGNANNNSLRLEVRLPSTGEIIESVLLTHLPKNSQGSWLSSQHSVDCTELVNLAYTAWNNPNGNGSPCAEDVTVTPPSNLPVELVHFKAYSVDSDQVKLEWATASEENNAYFEIQHSTNSLDFKPIGQVAGKGTTAEMQHYGYEHQYPAFGNNYYRIKQVDLDGKYEIFEVVQVKISLNAEIAVYPTHAQDRITLISENALEKNSFVRVIHPSGNVVLEKRLTTTTHKLSLDVFDLPMGMYFISMLDEEHNQSIVVKPFYKIGN